MPLAAVNDALNMFYELVIIAIKDEKTAENVRNMLRRICKIDCEIVIASELLHSMGSKTDDRV